MNDAHVTLVGWLAQDPFYTITQNGTPFLSLRVGCTPRRFDRQTAQWQDMDAMFLTVNCWRGLADNIRSSDLKRGDPVLVTGRLRIREYAKDGQVRFSAEVEASTLGHDLTRGSAEFRRVQRGGGMTPEDRREAEEHNDRWAEAGGLVRSGEDDESESPATAGGTASEGYHGDGRSDEEEQEAYDMRTTAA
ncbi:MAG: single-strand binding protein [Streptosporangiaceae bacterium]|jgi:single-strand DNA-binding protein|nr:single-strand binding protein [Streptosporangiaceae bacterium]